jgi:hypothetical protein
MYNIALDYDGVITSNFQHYFQLASDFQRSRHTVYILTAANKNRVPDIISQLIRLGFPSSQIISRPRNFISTTFNIGSWKKEQLKKYDIDLWFENDCKFYEQAGVDFSDIKTEIVRV